MSKKAPKEGHCLRVSDRYSINYLKKEMVENQMSVVSPIVSLTCLGADEKFDGRHPQLKPSVAIIAGSPCRN